MKQIKIILFGRSESDFKITQIVKYNKNEESNHIEIKFLLKIQQTFLNHNHDGEKPKSWLNISQLLSFKKRELEDLPDTHFFSLPITRVLKNSFSGQIHKVHRTINALGKVVGLCLQLYLKKDAMACKKVSLQLFRHKTYEIVQGNFFLKNSLRWLYTSEM